MSMSGQPSVVDDHMTWNWPAYEAITTGARAMTAQLGVRCPY
jgi:hypothetical protein